MSNGFNSYKVYFRRSNGELGTKLVDAQNPELAEYEARRYGRVIRVASVSPPYLIQIWILVQQLMNRFSPVWLRNLYPWNRRGFTFRERVEFMQSFSTMLRGYKLSEAVSMMAQNFSGEIRHACRRIRHSCVYEHKDLVDALKELGPRYIPGVTLAIIAINQRVGSLDIAFKEGLKFERDMAKLESGYIVKALMAMGWFLLTVASMFLMETYGWALLDDFDYFAIMPTEGETMDMVNLTKSLSYWTNVFGLVLFSIWLSGILVLGVGRDFAAQTVEKWILKIPVVRGAMLNRMNFVACYQVHTLMSKGIPIVECFQCVMEELQPGVLRDDFQRVITLLNEGSTDWVDGFHSFGDLERALLKSSTNQDEIAETFNAQSDQFLFNYQRSVDLFAIIHYVFTGLIGFSFGVILVFLMFIPMAGGLEVLQKGL